MGLSERRKRNVEQMVAQVRRAHPELRRPATWAAVQRAIARMGIHYRVSRTTRRTSSFTRLGVAVIALSAALPDEDRLSALLHEVGHIVLHADRDEGAVRELVACAPGDPRELEADYFAAELLAGTRRVVYAQVMVQPSPPAWPYGKYRDRLAFEMSRLPRIPRKYT